MLSPNDVKEELSLAFVHAIAARAGFAVECIRKDRDSIDLQIMARGRLSPESRLLSPQLGVQLKATARPIEAGETFAFDLPAKNYNDLVAEPVAVPRVLMVFVMPESEELWVETTEQALMLRHCAYWTSLRGQTATNNDTKKRVHVPRANTVTTHSLRQLLTRVSCEQDL